jgi:hypothetical protein
MARLLQQRLPLRVTRLIQARFPTCKVGQAPMGHLRRPMHVSARPTAPFKASTTGAYTVLAYDSTSGHAATGDYTLFFELP